MAFAADPLEFQGQGEGAVVLLGPGFVAEGQAMRHEAEIEPCTLGFEDSLIL